MNLTSELVADGTLQNKQFDNNQFVVGQIVKSVAGRDKNRFYCVLKVTEDYAFIADGKIRKIEKPKQKNLKHLSKTNKFFDVTDEENLTNKKLRQSLIELNNNNFVNNN